MADVSQIKTKITNAEFVEMPEHNQFIELIDGELVMSPTPRFMHQQVVIRLIIILNERLKSGQLVTAPMDVFLDEGVVLEPDLFWVSGETSLCQVGSDGWYHGAPDLVVEVLSPSTRKTDRGRKFKLYEQYGVRAYWLIDTDDQTVEVWRREGDHFVLDNLYERDHAFAFGLLPDVTIPVAELFK